MPLDFDESIYFFWFGLHIATNIDMHESISLIKEEIVDEFRFTQLTISNSYEGYYWAFIFEYVHSLVESNFFLLI